MSSFYHHASDTPRHSELEAKMGFPGLPPAADDADSSLSMAITAGHADHPQHNVGYVVACTREQCVRLVP